jgi:sirohydrochlorin cobaltochelatase
MSVAPTPGDDADPTAPDARIRTLLPEEYHATYEQMQPLPMKSAPLKFDDDGQVAWNEMWGSFCDLAMAGGPPHKGKLLGPAAESAIAAEGERYEAVQAEICRGIRVVTRMDTGASPVPGWIRMSCLGEGMAGWLLRAIVMENVAARADGDALDLPAGPDFRLEKEIRNVVTVASKTCHYWLDHMSFSQQRAITALLATMNAESPLVEPPLAQEDAARAHAAAADRLAADVERRTGLRGADRQTAGWLGLACPSVGAAVWMMRALVACNVLARREGTVLYVPVHAERDPEAHVVAGAVERMHRLAVARGVVVTAR